MRRALAAPAPQRGMTLVELMVAMAIGLFLVTVMGAIYLTAICVLPEMFIPRHLVGFGGTSLLIVVNVTIDTVTQIQSHLLAHQYGDLIKKARLKGGMRR